MGEEKTVLNEVWAKFLYAQQFYSTLEHRHTLLLRYDTTATTLLESTLMIKNHFKVVALQFWRS